MQLSRLRKPRRGLQIFDTRVDFPVPIQSGGRFYLYLVDLDNSRCPRYCETLRVLIIILEENMQTVTNSEVSLCLMPSGNQNTVSMAME